MTITMIIEGFWARGLNNYRYLRYLDKTCHMYPHVVRIKEHKNLTIWQTEDCRICHPGFVQALNVLDKCSHCLDLCLAPYPAHHQAHLLGIHRTGRRSSHCCTARATHQDMKRCVRSGRPGAPIAQPLVGICGRGRLSTQE